MNLTNLMIPTLKASLKQMGPGQKYAVLIQMQGIIEGLLDGDRAGVEGLLGDLGVSKPLADLLLTELLITDQDLA